MVYYAAEDNDIICSSNERVECFVVRSSISPRYLGDREPKMGRKWLRWQQYLAVEERERGREGGYNNHDLLRRMRTRGARMSSWIVKIAEEEEFACIRTNHAQFRDSGLEGSVVACHVRRKKKTPPVKCTAPSFPGILAGAKNDGSIWQDR